MGYSQMPMAFKPEPSFFAPSKRRSINVYAVCVNVFVPWFLFSALYGILSFSFHYTHPACTRAIYFLAFLVPVGVGIMAYVAKSREMQLPMWYTFSTLAFFLAVCAAGVFGDLNFWYNMQPHYDMLNLNTYPSVNPAIEKGQQLMDSGRVYFSSGTNLDTKKAMGFKNHDMYCVAPIVNGNEKLATYDFWAVGMNCCNGVSSDFRCGEFNNPHARSGLRLMSEQQRPFYRLAVQQAEAAYNIKAMHPIFFTWLQDPLAEVNSYREEGFKYYLMGIFTYFGFNLFCVVCAVIAFTKIGRY